MEKRETIKVEEKQFGELLDVKIKEQAVLQVMTTNNKLFSIYYGVRVLAQRVKHLPAKQETWVRSLGQEDPLEKEMATHSSILAWRVPWMEEPGGLQSTGLQSPTRLKRLCTACTAYSRTGGII